MPNLENGHKTRRKVSLGNPLVLLRVGGPVGTAKNPTAVHTGLPLGSRTASRSPRVADRICVQPVRSAILRARSVENHAVVSTK